MSFVRRIKLLDELTGNCSRNLLGGSKETACKTDVLGFAVQGAHDQSDQFQIANTKASNGSELGQSIKRFGIGRVNSTYRNTVGLAVLVNRGHGTREGRDNDRRCNELVFGMTDWLHQGTGNNFSHNDTHTNRDLNKIRKGLWIGKRGSTHTESQPVLMVSVVNSEPTSCGHKRLW